MKNSFATGCTEKVTVTNLVDESRRTSRDNKDYLGRSRVLESGCHLVTPHHCVVSTRARTKPTRTISSPMRLELADVITPTFTSRRTHTESCTWCYYRAGAIKEGSVEISGWRTLVSIESVVLRTSANHGGTNHENEGMPRRVYVAKGRTT